MVDQESARNRMEEAMTERAQRTLTQNNCIHLYCQQMADALNAAGLDMRKTLKPEIEIPWTKESVKEHIWRPIQEVMTGKRSTTEINTVDPSEIYEVITRHMGEKHGIFVQWPHEGPE